jgi:putative ABC transport system permease protein
MKLFRQFLALLRMNLSGLPERAGAVLTIIVGVTCAVGVLVSMLAMGAGARRQEMTGVRPDAVVVTSTGARSAMQSSISRDEAAAVRDLPGIRKDASGEPIVDPQSWVGVEGRRRGTGKRLYFPLLGVSPSIAREQPPLRLTAGRLFQPGLHELAVSNACVRQFTEFEIGDRRPIHGSDWVVVGHFERGETQECIVLADVGALMSAFGRNTYSQISLTLRDPGDFASLQRAIAANPSLHLEAHHESEFVRDSFKQLNALLDFVSYFVGTIMALAATLGAVNSLYAIVDSRRRELATLRALGFGAGAVVASVLCESMLLAVPGALLGSALAWAFFNGLSASPFGYSFQLCVTSSLAMLGVVWALGMGFVGGLLPAWRAARVPVTTALRAT